MVRRLQCELRRLRLVLLVQRVYVTLEVISSNLEHFPLSFKTDSPTKSSATFSLVNVLLVQPNMVPDDTNCGSKRPNCLLGLTIGFLDLVILLASVTHLASDPKDRKIQRDIWNPNELIYPAGARSRTYALEKPCTHMSALADAYAAVTAQRVRKCHVGKMQPYHGRLSVRCRRRRSPRR